MRERSTRILRPCQGTSQTSGPKQSPWHIRKSNRAKSSPLKIEQEMTHSMQVLVIQSIDINAVTVLSKSRCQFFHCHFRTFCAASDPDIECAFISCFFFKASISSIDDTLFLEKATVVTDVGSCFPYGTGWIMSGICELDCLPQKSR